jgi:hypothetical protein
MCIVSHDHRTGLTDVMLVLEGMSIHALCWPARASVLCDGLQPGDAIASGTDSSGQRDDHAKRCLLRRSFVVT